MATNPAATQAELKMETDKSASPITLHCTGRLVSTTCAPFEAKVRELIPGKTLLLIDMTGVNYIDSSALGGIVGLYLSAKRAGCQLKLINLTPRIKELLSMTRLMEVLTSHAQGEVFGF